MSLLRALHFPNSHSLFFFCSGRPYYHSFEHVHRPQRYRHRHVHPPRPQPPFAPRHNAAPSYGRSAGGGFGGGSHHTADIPGFDDFFKKIERAVEREIGDSPFQASLPWQLLLFLRQPLFFKQDGRSNTWGHPEPHSEDEDEPADGVVDNSGDLRPEVYRPDPARWVRQRKRPPDRDATHFLRL